jgi:LysR family glycine cleavage system transcriptional activator
MTKSNSLAILCFAIRYSQSSPEIYDEKQLFGDFVLPVCTPEFAKQYQLSHKQKSLQGAPLIHLDERTPDPQWADWIKWGEAFGFQQDTLQMGGGFRLSAGYPTGWNSFNGV